MFLPCINTFDHCALVEITAFRLESESCKGFFLQINFPPMRAFEFIRAHVTFKLPCNFSYQMKTPIVGFLHKNSNATSKNIWPHYDNSYLGHVFHLGAFVCLVAILYNKYRNRKQN